MDINDVVEEFVAILKNVFSKFKSILLFSLAIGAAAGVISGVASHNSNRMFEDNSPLAFYVAQNVLQFGLLSPIIISVLIFLAILFWFPSTIAKKRSHAYLTLIQVLNIAAAFTGITWFIALAWAIFPAEKSLIDPVVGNPTGLGRRNAGDTIGAAKQGDKRGNKFEKETDKQIDALIDMRAKGLISDEEFLRKKIAILQREN